ncbi:conserved hypothetical protein [Rippkaea orientalis PCC 8801]|uniref:Lipoprotein n=1 Tax=Rippkaea orientalis (strain PCC 8801 / RF-1) TaxID=41431 RepID=B7K622_RIPO1|nr:hypothetical protein [Rippkaea orientalis]ACK68075.1 conserved hypothetical protein [Rippkaea orientalis PCC 8801]
MIKIFTLIFLLTFTLFGCAETKVSQCQKIILITKNIAQESENNRQTKDIQKALKVADAFEEAAQNMKDLKISDEQLVKYQLGFAEVYQGYAQTTRQFVAALQKKDIPTLQLMQQQLRQLGRKEPELGEAMNRYCQSNL